MDELDRIEREIAIDAPAARVWKLVSEPGWYINDEQIVPHRVERRGDLDVVHDPDHGAFAFATMELDEPRYAAFRWLTDVDAPDGPSTLVEFRIEETSPTSVVLRVAESGFASLPESAEERRSRYDSHVEGWRAEMALAKRHTEEAVDAVG
ncbi:MULTISPECIES: ATPase [unclassified Rhodococcus (in: high G+C Gram-positive bacteria)]|uniref:ATPase n=1 Tax=unclassified Rhodococcus (in: high G+C Gram-positive bacteria) TaxID=192944 RepID=UPI000E2BB14E|nr:MULTISPECIES: ATPase [unclassified Rhodococcus (in: high G+C Gram-positive bacteria)]RDI12343.1 uncharacterized protein YndB with AHSA1/START domain [Rhodococcus sp. AG1013]